MLPGEGVQLLDARDGRVGDVILGAVLVQCDVDLTGTEDDALDFFGLGDGFAVLFFGDDPFELGVAGEFFDG